MKTPRLLLATALCCAALSATAQWQWIDKDGRKVFSDRPPPMDVPDKNILKQPGVHSRPVAAPSPAPAPAQAAASLPRPSGQDKELQERKAKAEAEEAAKKHAEEERLAKARADNCARARQAKTTYASGQPLTRINAQGEREFIDEATRAAETKRADEIIASNCQ
ncbi:MAG: DUF4124 domain-containing protein [Acidovorax sp.]